MIHDSTFISWPQGVNIYWFYFFFNCYQSIVFTRRLGQQSSDKLRNYKLTLWKTLFLTWRKSCLMLLYIQWTCLPGAHADVTLKDVPCGDMGHLFLSNLKFLTDVLLNATWNKNPYTNQNNKFNIKLQAKYQLNFTSEETGLLRGTCVI